MSESTYAQRIAERDLQQKIITEVTSVITTFLRIDGLEPNWLEIYTDDVFDGFTTHGPNNGLLEFDAKQTESILGKELVKRLITFRRELLPDGYIYGREALYFQKRNPGHTLVLIPGRTQFKIKDPRPYNAEQLAHAYQCPKHFGRHHEINSWDQPYWATVRHATDKGIEFMVVDEEGHPTGETFESSRYFIQDILLLVQNNERDTLIKYYENHRFDWFRGVHYRTDRINPDQVTTMDRYKAIEHFRQERRNFWALAKDPFIVE